MSDLTFFNTLGRRRERFVPLEAGVVRLYTCGPTVYNNPHIGNLRTFVFEDLLRRTLEWLDYRVVHVMNITDVEDKIIATAGERGVPIDELTAPFVEGFFADLDALGVKRAEKYPRATRFIPEMIEMIEGLLEREYAYLSDGCVFYRIDRFERYGELARIDLSQVRRGERVADDEYDKEDPRDFVLWKAAKPGEPSWDSPWGPGRPGWHIECSAMSRALLGDSFDIHCGGVDNIFPHHENEIAQSEAYTGETFARYWLHAEHLLVDGEKMSKSLGNQYTLADLVERGLDPRAIRYLLLSVHYRQKLNFTFDSVKRAEAALRRVDEMSFRLGRAPSVDSVPENDLVGAAEAAVAEAKERLSDDLNVSGALGALFGLVRKVNSRLERGVARAERDAVLGALRSLDTVFNLFDQRQWEAAGTSDETLADAAIDELVAQRAQARADRDFAEADRLRDQLTGAGIVIEDTAGGTIWRRR